MLVRDQLKLLVGAAAFAAILATPGLASAQGEMGSQQTITIGADGSITVMNASSDQPIILGWSSDQPAPQQGVANPVATQLRADSCLTNFITDFWGSRQNGCAPGSQTASR